MADPSQLVTPEAVVLGLTPAGAATRALSRLIDAVVLFVLTLVFIFALGAMAAAGLSETIITISIFFFLFALLFAYPIACELLFRGRSVGKLLLGLRVVTTEGAPIRFRHSAIRAFADIVDFWMTGGGIGLVSIAASKRDQRLGDMVAGTLVIRERATTKAPQAVGFQMPPGYEDYARTLDVAGVTPADYQAIRSFLLRAQKLTPAARAQVAGDLAALLAGRLRHAPPSWLQPELFLVVVAALVQRRSAALAPLPQAPSWGAPPPVPSGATLTPGWGAAVPTPAMAPANPTADAGGFAAPG